MVDDDEDTSKDKEIDKLMDLISLSFKKIYKPTNNNLRTSSNTSHANQDNSLRIHRNAGYEGQRSGTVAGARETVGSSMVSPDAVDSGPICDKEPEQKTLHAYFAAEGIQHQTSVARTPEQNDVVERRNRTLVEAARTMLSVTKVPLFFWAEAIATACSTQNRSLVIPHHEKTLYHIINDRKPSVKFFHIFGSSRAYKVFNKRTRVIIESIHVNFDELPQMVSAHNSSDPAPTCQTMASDQHSSDPAPECQTMALEHVSLSPGRKCQENASHEDRTVTTSNELDLLFSLMFDELLNGSSKVVSKSSAVSAADAPNERQQLTTPLTNHTTPAPTCQTPTIAPTAL
nr:hypothetical protein [Tanacetum cinerariifolium]